MTIADAAHQDRPFKCLPLKAATCLDQALFYHIGKAARGIQRARIWGGTFDLSKVPLYIVHWDGKRADRGFLIHAPTALPGTIALSQLSYPGSLIHRYDGALKRAEKTANGLFDMNFEMAGTSYFLMLYTDFKTPTSDVQARDKEEWIRILVHETFHLYQSTWLFPENIADSGVPYPLTKPILTLSLLELAVLGKGVQSSDTGRLNDLLKMYVAVRQEKIDRDPSDGEAIRNTDNIQEYLEGTAKYVEIQTAALTDPDFPRSHYAFEVETPIANGFEDTAEMHDFFTFGIWYFSGSMLLDMLSKAKIAFIETIQNGKTPFDVVSEHFHLSANQRSGLLERAKREFNYPALQDKAAGYLQEPTG